MIEQVRNFFAPNQKEHDREMSEEEKSNEFLKPFKIGDKVDIVPHLRSHYVSGKEWTVYAYSKELGLALLYKMIIKDGKSDYIYDKATLDELKKWNPEVVE
jgi:hypothetical protein